MSGLHLITVRVPVADPNDPNPDPGSYGLVHQFVSYAPPAVGETIILPGGGWFLVTEVRWILDPQHPETVEIVVFVADREVPH